MPFTYCERTGPGLCDEPLNAVTNAAFLVAAWAVWRLARRRCALDAGIRVLIGLLIASLVNIFIHSSGLGFAISVIGVFIFVGLTAYDTQNIKENFSETWGQESNGKLAVMGALRLYLDFINLFMMLLRLMGNRR